MVTEYNIEYRKYQDNMKATTMNMTEKLEGEQENISLMTKDGTEEDKWSVGSEHTSDTEPMDSDEREQAITTIEMIDGGKKGNKEK